jgi:hypothetical protein
MMYPGGPGAGAAMFLQSQQQQLQFQNALRDVSAAAQSQVSRGLQGDVVYLS